MRFLKNTILPLLAATFWISLSEFLRNEFLIKSMWTDHYASLGLTFPSDPVNGMIWGIWSLFFALAIFILAKKFSFIQTTFIAWWMAFAMMWLVIGNMGVLPFGSLVIAFPLSLLETSIAVYIIRKLSKSQYQLPE